jgi:hypothetical protein
MNKFEEHAVILISELLDAKAPVFFRLTNSVPSQQTLRAMTLFFASPQSVAARIQEFKNGFRNQSRGHVVNGKAAKDSVHKNQTPSSAKQSGFPARKEFIKFGDQGLIVSDADLVGRQGETKVRLRERGDNTPEDSRHGGRGAPSDLHGDEGRFVIIYGQPRGRREVLQDSFEDLHRPDVAFNKDQGVVRILENGGKAVMNQWGEGENHPRKLSG